MPIAEVRRPDRHGAFADAMDPIARAQVAQVISDGAPLPARTSKQRG